MHECHSHTLDRSECEELLAGARIGRVILTEQALPTALPVAYALDHGDIVFRSNDGTKIAAEMHLAEKTVKNYVSSLLAKLGMERRTQAAVFAARLDG